MKQKIGLFIGFSVCVILFNPKTVRAQSWTITGNNNTTALSRLGTNNLIPLGLYTNSAERLHIDESGRVGIGTSAPVNILTVKSGGGTPSGSWLSGLTAPVFIGFADNASSEFVLSTASNTSVRRSVIQGRKSRGTLAAPTAVANNDYLTSFLASGYDGNTFQNPATIDFFVDGNPSSGNVPTRISFVTGSNQGNRLERLKVGSTGNFNFNNTQITLTQSNGKVGIGTAAPDGRLHVFNGSAGTVAAHPDAQLVVENSSNNYINILAPSTNESGILFGNPGSNVDGGIIFNNSNYPHGLEFRTNNNDTKMVLTQEGNLGVGTNPNGAKVFIQNSSQPNGVNSINSYTAFEDRRGIYTNSVGNPGFGIGLESVGGYYGIIGTSNSTTYTGATWGISGSSSGTTTAGTRYGLNGQASGSANAYGVYGSASGAATFNAAGYFNGDVWATNYQYLSSDRKFKNDITSMKTGSIEKIMKLKPSSYVFKNGEFGKMQFPQGTQFGLIADEVKQVFPQLVKQGVFPAEYGADRKLVHPEIKYEGVNYVGLIPVLVASTQEQQKQIDAQQVQIQAQQQQIDELKQMILQAGNTNGTLTNLSSVSLGQNNPNPLDKFTSIPYSIPPTSRKAQLVVADMYGKKIKELSLATGTQGNLKFDATSLSSGTYTYSIIVDGRLTDTKKMVVVKSNNY